MIPRWSRSRSRRSESSRSSLRAFAAIRRTRSSASSAGMSSSRLLERERRAEDRRERRAEVVRDGLEERVLHLVERAEPLRCLSLALEGLGVLPLARAKRLLGALAFGDVDHETAEDLSRAPARRGRRGRGRGSTRASVGRSRRGTRGLVARRLDRRRRRPVDRAPRGRGPRCGRPTRGRRRAHDSVSPPSRSCTAPGTGT